MTHKAPGKAHREGITLIQLARMFPDEEAARQWFEAIFWPDGERDYAVLIADNGRDAGARS